MKKVFKKNIDVYVGSKKELLPRRQELLDEITKSDTYLPDTILHDDLDKGMLEYVEKQFKVVSDNKVIPVIPRILTIQRWGEITNTWEYVDDDNNIQLPFISVVRKPDVQPGTNPSIQRTIPDRYRFHYATVKTWNGGQLGADVYKIPQPIPVDITYEITIVCNKFRDLNRFNKIVMQRFTSRQDYTIVKGHYIPIILDRIEDNTPLDTLDGRRFYVQNYQFTMLGFLIDNEEFEVKPAINRTLLLTEFIDTKKFKKRHINKTVDLVVLNTVANGEETIFDVGEPIGLLFYVAINGMVQQHNIDYYFIPSTTRITFVTPPIAGSVITIVYYRGRNSYIIDDGGRPIQNTSEYFTYDGSTLEFNVTNRIDSVVYLEINGLVQEEGEGFEISGLYTVKLKYSPITESRIGINYFY